MIDCNRTRELMSDYLEDDIRPEDKEEVSAHLSMCTACSMVFKKTRILISQMAMMNNVSVSMGFDGNLAAQIQELRRHPNADKVRSFARGAAVGAAAAGVLFVVSQNSQEPVELTPYSGNAVKTSKVEMASSAVDSAANDSTVRTFRGTIEGNIKMVNDRK